MAALLRRLGNFTKWRPKTETTFKSLSTKATNPKSELQKCVDKFKKSCEDNQFRRNKQMYNRHVIHLAKAKEFAMIEDSLEHQKKYDEIRSEGFAARLIRLYGESGMFDHARKLFDELPALQCTRTAFSFNALLQAGIDAEKFDRVIEAFEELPAAISVQPDMISHNTVIHALCKMGSLDEALSKFREPGNEPDVVTFNTLLNALYKGGRFSEGETLWAEMNSERESRVDPNVRSYNIRLRAMFAENKSENAIRAAAEMLGKGIKADAYTYNALICGLCGNGNMDEALACYEDLRRKKYRPYVISTYLALIQALVEAGDIDRAFKLCMDAVKHRLTLDAALCHRVVDGLNDKGKTKEASMLKIMMRPEGYY